MIQTGQILNDTYEVLESLGSGTGGIIFKAYHKRMKKYVAIKLIKNELRDKTDIRLEIDVLKNLKHEFLPQVIDFFEAENDVYTVIEFIEGKNFKQLVKEGHTFTEEQVRKYGMQLCSAVEYLHSQNPPIIHSDIKPANIMLTPKDNICLIDFNISTISSNGIAVSKGGSMSFAAPEQFRRIIDIPEIQDDFREETRFMGEGTKTSQPYSETGANIAYIDVRTDIYGVGTSLYYILTQRIPANNTLDFRGIDCSAELKNAILTATDPIPSRRYRNMSECKAAIAEKSGNNPLMKFGAAAIIAAVALTVGILLGSSGKTAGEISTDETSAEETTSSLAVTTIATAVFISEETTTPAETTAAPVTTPAETTVTVRQSLTVTTPPPATETQPAATTKAVTTTKKETTNKPAVTSTKKTTTKTTTAATENYYISIKGVKHPVDSYELNLSAMDLTSNDIKPLNKMKEIMYLNLSCNQITDISMLKDLTDLTYLSLWDNSITDINALKKLTSLTELSLRDNGISNITPLGNLAELTILYLNDNKITDISALKKLTSLTELYLNDNMISDISPLGKLTDLQVLYLNDNNISDISALKKLTNLEFLYLGGNQITAQDLDELQKAIPDCMIYSDIDY